MQRTRKSVAARPRTRALLTPPEPCGSGTGKRRGASDRLAGASDLANPAQSPRRLPAPAPCRVSGWAPGRPDSRPATLDLPPGSTRIAEAPDGSGTPGPGHILGDVAAPAPSDRCGQGRKPHAHRTEGAPSGITCPHRGSAQERVPARPGRLVAARAAWPSVPKSGRPGRPDVRSPAPDHQGATA